MKNSDRISVIKRWLYSEILICTYIVVFLWFMHRVWPGLFSDHHFDRVAVWKTFIPYILCSVFVTLQTDAILSMKKKWGILFCGIHIPGILGLQYIHYIRFYIKHLPFPFFAEGEYYLMLLANLVICLFLLLINRGKAGRV